MATGRAIGGKGGGGSIVEGKYWGFGLLEIFVCIYFKQEIVLLKITLLIVL